MDTEAGPQYAGTKSSRQELYGQAFGRVENSDDEEEDVSSSQGDDNEDDAIEEDDISEDDEEIPSDEDESEGSSSKPTETSTRGASSRDNNAHLDKDSKAMLQQLKQASTADIEKGRDVRKQLVSPCNCFPITFHIANLDTLPSLSGILFWKLVYVCRSVLLVPMPYQR